MYTEIYSLSEDKHKKLAEYLSSDLYYSEIPESLQSSEFWTKLQQKTFVGVNPHGVFLHSGHNYIHPRYKMTIANRFLKYILKFCFFHKILRGIRKLSCDLADRKNAFDKLDSAKSFTSLSRCPYAGKYIVWSTVFEKALPYNAPNVYSAAENIAYISRALHDHRPGESKFVFLEIGAGAGMTVLGLLELYPGSKVIICDLPETIPVGYTIMSFFGDKKILLPNDWEGGDVRTMSEDIFYVTPDQLSGVTDKSVDFFINAHSMQEMTSKTIRNYFVEISRLGKKKSIFYCNNLRDSRQHYNSFKDYPWDVFGGGIYEGYSPFNTKQYPEFGPRLVKLVFVNK